MDGEIVGRELRVLDDGRQAWFYADGPVELRDVKTGQIIAARGQIAGPAQARALAAARWAAVEAAKWDGLAAAAAESGLATDDMPAAAVAAIVKRLALSAANGDSRAANDAARIVLQLVGLLSSGNGSSRQDDSRQAPSDGLQVTVGAELAERLMIALADVRRDRRQVDGAQPQPQPQPTAAADTAAAAADTDTGAAHTHTDTRPPETARQITTPHPTLLTSGDNT